MIDEATLHLVVKNIQRLFKDKVQEFFMPIAKLSRDAQANTLHENVVCNNCQAHPIQGIRYKCTVCGDYDLCEKCEGEGVHPEHVLCKIRRPSQAPVKLICQYSSNGITDPNFLIAQAMSLEGQQQEE